MGRLLGASCASMDEATLGARLGNRDDRPSCRKVKELGLIWKSGASVDRELSFAWSILLRNCEVRRGGRGGGRLDEGALLELERMFGLKPSAMDDSSSALSSLNTSELADCEERERSRDARLVDDVEARRGTLRSAIVANSATGNPLIPLLPQIHALTVQILTITPYHKNLSDTIRISIVIRS